VVVGYCAESPSWRIADRSIRLCHEKLNNKLSIGYQDSCRSGSTKSANLAAVFQSGSFWTSLVIWNVALVQKFPISRSHS